MFVPGLTTQDEVHPVWWNAYVHLTLVRITSANRTDLLNQWASLVGGTQIFNTPSDDNFLSGMSVVRDEGSAVVAFQGTSNTLQVLAQIMQSPQGVFTFVGGAVNGYYGACYQERLAAFQSVLNTLPVTFQFFFVGHSAGGAIAHVAYKYFDEFIHYKTLGCITYGQPRTGNAYFANGTISPFLRLIAQDDFVVGLPPGAFQSFALLGPFASVVLGLNYSHARDGVILFNDGTTLPGNASILDTWGPPLASAFLRLRSCWPACYSAHATLNYATLLQRLAARQGSPISLAPFIAMNAAIG